MKFPFDPNSSTRYRIEKKIWYLLIVVWIGIFLFLRPIFNLLWPLFVVITSIYALGISADGAEEAAKSRENTSGDSN